MQKAMDVVEESLVDDGAARDVDKNLDNRWQFGPNPDACSNSSIPCKSRQ